MMRTACRLLLAGPEICTAATHDPLRDTAHWINFFDEPVQIVFMGHFGGTVAGLIAASLSAGSGPLMQPIRFVRIGSVCVIERLPAPESIASG